MDEMKEIRKEDEQQEPQAVPQDVPQTAPAIQMRTYIGAKLVQARPMDEYTYLREIKGVDLETGNIPARNRPGYLVKYADDYRSWSPKDVYEEAYREVSNDEKRIFVPDREDPERIKEIARVCHEVNRAYCEALGDNSQVAWDDAPDWQKNSAIAGVLLHMNCPDVGPEGSHESWLRIKEEEGWKYGPVKNVEKKEHPCMVPFDELPREQQAKYYIFRAIVHALMKA